MLNTKWKVAIGLILLSTAQQLYTWIYRRMNKLPPGPMTPTIFRVVMIILRIFRLRSKNVTKDMTNHEDEELVQSYGYDGIMYQNISGRHLIKICSSKMAKEVLTNKCALDRPLLGHAKNVPHIESIDDGTLAFSALNGEIWEKRRKISQSILFRMCTSTFINKILDESINDVLFKEIDEMIENDKLFYPNTIMKYIAFNTIFYANFGYHISPNSNLYKELVDVITKTFELFKIGLIFTFISKYILFFVKLNPNSKYHEIKRVIKKRSKLIRNLIKLKLETTNNENNDNNDNDEYYINYCKNKLSESEMEADVTALFSAATDTTSSTLSFIIVYCAKYGDIQNKVRRELIECYNQNSDHKENKNMKKKFDISWINNLHFFRAFIYEIMRIANVTKVGLPHYTTNDIYVHGDKTGKQYKIPKNSMILYLIEQVHGNGDTENWMDSSMDKLCLNNWLNKETNKFQVNKSFLTFGAGRRDCVGKQFAFKQIYIIIGYLLLNYTFTFQDEHNIPDIKTRYNGVSIIHPPIGVVAKHIT